MDLAEATCERSHFFLDNPKAGCPDACVSQSHAKHSEPSVAGCMLGRALSCRDSGGGAHFQQPSNCPPRAFQQTFPGNEVLIAPDPKSSLNGCGTGLHPIYRESLSLGAKSAPQGAHSLLTDRDYGVESAHGCPLRRNNDSDLKSSNSFGAIRQDAGNKSSTNKNYINCDLVQKILTGQQNLRRTKSPMIHLGEVSRTGKSSAGQNGSRHENPGHHLSDVSLGSKTADCRIKDLDAVSTESQKESGYHSGDSAGDRSSATSDTVDLNRPTTWTPGWMQSRPENSSTSVDRCDYYFVQADNSMDMYSEHERMGDLNQALTFLNQAIEFFKMAADVPDASSEDVLRMRMKQNKAVLCQRKLLKQIGASAAGKPPRKLPCLPQDGRQTPAVDSNSQNYDKLVCGDTKNAFSSSGTEPVRHLKNKTPEESKIAGITGGSRCCRDDFSARVNTNVVNDLNPRSTPSRKCRNSHLALVRVASYPKERPTFPLSSSDYISSNQKKDPVVYCLPPSGCSNRRGCRPPRPTAQKQELQIYPSNHKAVFLPCADLRENR